MLLKTLKIALLLALPVEAQAQMSGCVRDSTGALQCTSQRPQALPSAPALRAIPRADLSRDALRRSDALIGQRRDALERQGRELDEQRTRFRRDCLDRAAGTTACSL